MVSWVVAEGKWDSLVLLLFCDVCSVVSRVSISRVRCLPVWTYFEELVHFFGFVAKMESLTAVAPDSKKLRKWH